MATQNIFFAMAGSGKGIQSFVNKMVIM